MNHVSVSPIDGTELTQGQRKTPGWELNPRPSVPTACYRMTLLFLLDDELSSIQLCALHMEMRYTELLLASIGLIAHKIDSLRETNNALRSYGRESFHGDHITVKKKAEQQSAVTRHNTCVSSMPDKCTL